MKIKFSCEQHLIEAIPHPVSAAKAIPEYYKNIKPQINSTPDSSTAKRCMPFLDAMSAGFIIPLWCDLFFTAKNGDIGVSFPKTFAQKEVIGTHSMEQLPNHPMANKPYGKVLAKLISPWIVQTPPGTSCLFTSPLNHMESRLKLWDGIVDTDTYYNTVSFPFIWTGGDGEFLIEKGTPIVQVIPFKRETVKLHIEVMDSKKRLAAYAKLGTRMSNGYRDEFWHARRKSPLAGWRLILDKIRRIKS